MRRHPGLLLALALALAPLAAAESISWRSGPRTLERLDPESRAERLRDLSARRVVVGFDGPISPERRDELRALGLELLRPLDGHAWFATLSSTLAADALAAEISAVAAIPLDAKLHPSLAAGPIPSWSRLVPRVEAGLDTNRSYVAVYLHVHADADRRELPGLLAEHGGGLLTELRSIDAVVAWIPLDALEALTAEDDVMYVEPPLPPLSTTNAENRAVVGADTLASTPYDLDGSGVTVMVYDGGRAYPHADFGSRLTQGPSDTSGADSSHATHVAGTIGGDGSESGGANAGMAPGVEILTYGFEQAGGQLFQGFLYTDPGDIEYDYSEAISLGADLVNNSIGPNVRSNGFPCHWEGDYGTIGAVIDAITRGSLGRPFINVWANGNERSGAAECGADYYTTAPAACAKNNITVGALNANDESVTGFTSFGPCDDGRLKPTLSAPGCQGNDDFGVTSTRNGGGYRVACGTSMSAPTLTGVSALVLEQYRLSFPGADDPLPATLRAILAHTAQDLEEPGPDYKTGYGGLRGVAAVELVQQQRLLEQAIAHGETYRFAIEVAPADTELKVTLAWDDPPAAPNVVDALVNDLDLRVIDSSGTVHRPWTLDPADPGAPAVRTQKDAINNIEQVVIDAPAPGSYLIEVEAFDVAEGPVQSFGLAASPAPLACDSAASLLAQAARIDCEGALSLRLLDCDLNVNALAADSVALTASSDSEPTGESLVLDESDLDTGFFQGSLPVSGTDSAGTLLVQEGDLVTVSYVDADDGQGNPSTPHSVSLIADCEAPLVGSVNVHAIGAGRATVDVAADSPVEVVVHYGPTCGAPTSSRAGRNRLAAQSVYLDDLVPDTAYYLHVEVTDELGRTTIDDNGGLCWSFATLPTSIFLATEYSGFIDTDYHQLTFTPDGSVGYYAACGTYATELPTDTSADPGTPGDFVYDLTGGAVLTFYGQTYSRIYVGRAGYVTFGAPDSDYSATPIDFYSLPRVSGAFDPMGNGTSPTEVVQTADRVAVTWDNGFDYFQIELFFDGRIRITWDEMATDGGIVGLSDGNGLDPAFQSRPLLGGVCPQAPPTVRPLELIGEQHLTMQVSLMAHDDGLPGPIRLRIEQLPQIGGLIDDATGLPIVTTPHTLPLGASTVSYVPAVGWHGSESFLYGATDGGSAPDGGVSVPAPVTVRQYEVNTTLQQYLVDDQDPGWITGPEWAFGPPGGTQGNPPTGYTGSNVYGYALNGQYDHVTGQHLLTTTPIDISGATDRVVRFRRWLRTADGFDDATFRIRTETSGWTTAYTSQGAPVEDLSWVQVAYAIPDGDTVWFQWGLGPTSPLDHDAGWNIDDIEIEGFLTGDCSPDPDVMRQPAEVTALHVDGDAVSWNDQVARSGSATSYELISGALASGLVDPSPLCLQDSTTASFDDTRVPVPGQGFYYLVQAWNACGRSGFGAARDAAFPDGDGDGPSDVCDP